MHIRDVEMLVIITGVVIFRAVDALRWRLRYSIVFVAFAIPLTVASCVCLYFMIAYPHWMGIQAWRYGQSSGCGPEEHNSNLTQKQLCVRNSAGSENP